MEKKGVGSKQKQSIENRFALSFLSSRRSRWIQALRMHLMLSEAGLILILDI